MMTNMSPGILAISLGLELYWGMKDIIALEDYEKNLQGVRQALPAILELFKRYEIHATWATVGFLYYSDIKQLQRNLPQELPSYEDKELSPFKYIHNLSREYDKQLHFCPDLIESIKQCPGQEIATHTFSHYYCLEEGQTQAQFRADLNAAIEIAKKANIETKSLVFPRNQYNPAYLEDLYQCGITSYRGNENNPIYNSELGDGDRLSKRILRLIDAYINLTGQNCYSRPQLNSEYPLNIPSSRFLRPYSAKLKYLDILRLRRITSGLKYAATRGLIYHLWWHPHNFGVNLQENLDFLEKILQSYQKLHTQHQMQSFSMGEITELCTVLPREVEKVYL